MTHNTAVLLLLCSTLSLCVHCSAHTFVPVDLKCENKVAPVGTCGTPTFSWKFQSISDALEGKNRIQKAYQVVVQREKNNELMWDTKRVISNVNHQLIYGGKDLESHAKYQWKVRVWDQDDSVTPWSTLASFTTSVLYGNWSAQWISSQTGSPSTANYLRKDFSISPSKKIYQAMVSVTGLGLYQLYLNGEKVGDDEISNGFTNYNRTVFVATYDVTASLRGSDANYFFCFGMILGNGMYNVVEESKRYTKFVGSYGPRKLFLQLDVEYTDGSITTVISDGTWKATQGPITFTSIYGGEDYNANMEEAGWDMPNFNDTNWTPVDVVPGPAGVLTPIDFPTVKVKEVLTTQNVTQLTETSYLYDLGHNFAGWPHIKVKGAPGAVVVLTPGEILVNGEVDQASSGSPSYYTYVLKGGVVEEWHPRFSYYGFRWVQVNITGQADIISMEGHFIYADMDVVGSFLSSNQLFNQIHEIIITSYKSNLQSIFHDCPHREKLGWLEQAHLLAKSIAYNFDISKLFAKSVRDMYESQVEGGLIPDIAPEYTVFPGPFRDAPEWGSSYILVPYFLYQHYGDIATLSQYYDSMLQYLGHLTSNAQNNIISYGLGDWCDIILFPSINYSPFPKLTPVNFTSTSVYYEDIVAMNASAQALGLGNYVQQMSALAESVKQSYNSAFFNSSSVTYSTNSQTSNSMALALGLSDAANTDAIVAAIVANVRTQQNHTTSGEVGHVYLLRALASNGRSDVVYDIHTQTDLAGYGYMLASGATALAEMWNFELGASHNHAMFGHIEEWFYEYLGGIKFSLDNIVIEPTILADMNFVTTTFKSIFGIIETSWKKDPATSLLHLSVTLPVNARATIHIPVNGVDEEVWESGVEVEEWEVKGVMVVERRSSRECVVRVGSGEYHFTSKMF